MKNLFALLLAVSLLAGCSTLQRLGITEDTVATGVQVALARRDLAGAVSDAQLREIIAIVKAEARLQEIGEEVAEDQRIQSLIEDIIGRYVVDGEVVVPETKPKPENLDAAGDEIDLAMVTWDGLDISGWAVTTDLRASRSGDKMMLSNSGTSSWKDVGSRTKDGRVVVGNAWVIAKINGEWRAATWEWLVVGQQQKAASAVAGDHIKKSTWGNDWRPSPGEELYFAVSGLCRDSARNNHERSPFVRVTW